MCVWLGTELLLLLLWMELAAILGILCGMLIDRMPRITRLMAVTVDEVCEWGENEIFVAMNMNINFHISRIFMLVFVVVALSLRRNRINEIRFHDQSKHKPGRLTFHRLQRAAAALTFIAYCDMWNLSMANGLRSLLYQNIDSWKIAPAMRRTKFFNYFVAKTSVSYLYHCHLYRDEIVCDAPISRYAQIKFCRATKKRWLSLSQCQCHQFTFYRFDRNRDHKIFAAVTIAAVSMISILMSKCQWWADVVLSFCSICPVIRLGDEFRFLFQCNKLMEWNIH